MTLNYSLVEMMCIQAARELAGAASSTAGGLPA